LIGKKRVTMSSETHSSSTGISSPNISSTGYTMGDSIESLPGPFSDTCEVSPISFNARKLRTGTMDEFELLQRRFTSLPLDEEQVNYIENRILSFLKKENI
jgi:hypothetical protein